MTPVVDVENVDFSRLTNVQRIELIGRIWDTIDEGDFVLTEAQRAELERRVAAEDASGDQGVTWAELKRRVQEKP